MGARDAEYPEREDLPVPESEPESGAADSAASDSEAGAHPVELPSSSEVPAEPDAPAFTSELLSNDDLNDLLASINSGKFSRPPSPAPEADAMPVDPPADPGPEPDPSTFTSELLSNDDLNNLLASIGGGSPSPASGKAAEGPKASPAEHAAAVPVSEALSNDDIDSLLASFASGKAAEPDVAGSPEGAEEPPAAEVSGEEGVAAPEEPIATGSEEVTPAGKAEILSNEDIESLLASLTSGKEDVDAPPPALSLEPDDEIIEVGREQLADLRTPPEGPKESPAPPEEPAEELQPAAKQEATGTAEPVTQEMLEALLREARRPTESAPASESESAPAPAAKPPARESAAPVPVDVPEVEPKIPRAFPARFLVSASVGLFTAACLYLFLVTHPYRAADVETMRTLRRADPIRAITLAQGLIDNGRYSEGLNELEPVMGAVPPGKDRVNADFLRAEAEYHLLPDKAKVPVINKLRAELDRLLKEAPEHPRALEARRLRADLFRRADMPEEAYQAYSEILADAHAEPGFDAVLLDAARLAAQLNKPGEAVDYLRRLIGAFPDSSLRPEAELALGRAYLASGDRQAGEMMLTSVARGHSDSALGAEAYVTLGNLQYDAGNYDEAIRLFETRLQTAIKVEGNDEIYLLLARAHRAKGQLPEAERVLRELIDFFPESPDVPAALVELSQVLDAQGRREEAVNVAKQAAEQHADDADVLANAGRMLAETGDTSAAAEALVAAERAGAEDPRVLLDAAYQWFAAKDLAKAGETLQRVVDSYPDSPEALQAGIELARVDRERGQTRAALERLEALLTASKDQPVPVAVLDALATLYNDLGLYERSADLFREIAGTTSDSALLARAALAMLKAGRTDDARTVASRVDPAALPEPLAYALLMRQGEALAEKEPESAVALMDSAYEQYPDQRTPDDVRRVLQGNLALGRTAAARGIVMDLDAHVRATPADAPLLERAAACWGDYLYRRGDYRAAEEAYALASAATGAPKSADGLWSRLQQANCRLQMQDLQGSGRMFEEVAASSSEWREVARAKADYVKLQLRRRGETLLPPPEPQEQPEPQEG